MNISVSTFRVQLIDRNSNSKCPTVLKQKDNQIRQAENTFSPKWFYPESYQYLIVFYEFSITRSSIFEPDSHRISHPSFTRVPSSFLVIFKSNDIDVRLLLFSIELKNVRRYYLHPHFDMIVH
jgi:hypothetical protein